MKKTKVSKRTNQSDEMPLDGTDILPPLEEISDEELFSVHGGTGWYLVDAAISLVGTPAPKNRPHDPRK
jgi:hypothetical protein